MSIEVNNSFDPNEAFDRRGVNWEEFFSDGNHQIRGPRYVEFGKVFHEEGATDWETLDYSDISIRKFAKEIFVNGFGFIETHSPFVRGTDSDTSRKVSIAFKEFDGEENINGFVYAQLQQREEGEFSKNPRTNRIFIQARFTYLTSDEISKVIRHSYGLYASLFYNNYALNNVDHMGLLKDYIDPNKGKRVNWPITLLPLLPDELDISLVKSIVNALLASSQPTDSSNKFIRTPRPIVVTRPGLSILDKLKIVDAVQYYVYPVLGIITFALDYVTDRSVLLRFYDAYSSVKSEKYVYRIEDGNEISIKNNLSDYFETVSLQYPKFLSNNYFLKFLKKGYSAQAAARRTNLSSKKFDEYDINEWVFHVTEFVVEIDADPKEREIIYDGIDFDNFQLLLMHEKISEELIHSLLHYKLDKTRGNFVSFLSCYLALPEPRRRNVKITQIFQEAVYSSTMENFSQIPESDWDAVFKELLLNRYLIVNEKITPKPLCFSSDRNEEIPIFTLLLRFPGQNLFKAIRNVLEREAKFSEEIANQLYAVVPAWNYEQIDLFWKTLGSNDFQIYEALLRVMLSHNLPELIEHPNWLKQFLELGRQVLRNQSDGDQQFNSHLDEDIPNGKSVMHLLPCLEQNVQNALREACVKIAVSLNEENLRFVEWWLFAELGYVDEESIKEDYIQLVTIYSSDNVNLDWAITAEFKYLVSRGKLGLVSSLQRACRECDDDVKYLLETTNQNLFKAISSVWVEKGIPLLPDDLMLMISQLPKTNETLADVVYSDIQKDVIALIKPEYALIWLEKTGGALRQRYITDGDDYLCNRLLELKNPDSALVWRMLVEEEGSFPSKMKWDQYVQLCQSEQTSLENNKISISDELKNYFGLVNILQDPKDLGSLNRVILKLFVNNILRDKFPEIADFTDQKLKALYIYYDSKEKNKYSPKIKKFARAFLIYYLTEPNLRERIDNLTEATRKALRSFAVYEKDSLVESVMQALGIRGSKEKSQDITDIAKTHHAAAQANMSMENNQATDEQKDSMEIENQIEIININDDGGLDLGGVPFYSVRQTDSQVNQQSDSSKLKLALFIMLIIAAVISVIIIVFIIVDLFTGSLSSWIIDQIR